MNEEKILEKRVERYYWETQDGKFIPVDELTDLHIVNIVIKFGKDKLSDLGHSRIIEKFDELRKISGFYV